MYILIILLIIIFIMYLFINDDNLDLFNINNDINQEKLKLIEKGYIDIEPTEIKHTYEYICDVRYTNIIYCDNNSINTYTLFDTGNESDTYCNQEFVNKNKLNKYPKLASKYQISQYNKLMNKFDSNEILKDDNITVINMIEKIKQNTKKIQENNPNIDSNKLQDMIGILNDTDVFGNPINITHQVVIPFMIVGTNKKLFVTASVLSDNNTSILFSNKDIHNLASHGIHIGLHPVFIKKHIKLNKLQKMYDDYLYEKTIDNYNLSIDDNSMLLHIKNLEEKIEKVKKEIMNERDTLIDAQLYKDTLFCKNK